MKNPRADIELKLQQDIDCNFRQEHLAAEMLYALQGFNHKVITKRLTDHVAAKIPGVSFYLRSPYGHLEVHAHKWEGVKHDERVEISVSPKEYSAQGVRDALVSYIQGRKEEQERYRKALLQLDMVVGIYLEAWKKLSTLHQLDLPYNMTQFLPLISDSCRHH
ncbi:MAG: hypothetical protein PHT59_07555 [Candidatus Omnitrophica bacterium]|nr:hypothetical protein [Candidatus Omnitrophota bacterium]